MAATASRAVTRLASRPWTALTGRASAASQPNRLAARTASTTSTTPPSTPPATSRKGYIVAGGALVALGTAWYYSTCKQCSTGTACMSSCTASDKMLTSTEYRPFKLQSIRKISPDTAVFRFDLPDKTKPAGMTMASFLFARFVDSKGQEIARPYTPTSQESDVGYLDLLIKRYDDGLMTNHIFGLKEGDLLELKGPIMKYEVKPNMHDSMTMVAGGTGITPMYQVICKLLKDSTDKTKISLIFGNRTPADILLKSELDELASKHKDRFHVHYVVDKAEGGKWSGLTGHVNSDLIKKLAAEPASAKNTKVFVCGPPGMVKAISGPKAPDYSQGDLDGALKDLGYNKDQVFKF